MNRLGMPTLFLRPTLFALLAKDLVAVTADDLSKRLTFNLGAVHEQAPGAVDFYFHEPAPGEARLVKVFATRCPLTNFRARYCRGLR
jgi:hypothetical protein